MQPSPDAPPPLEPLPPPGSTEPPPPRPERPLWQRVLWMGAGGLALLTGIIGIFVPLLPTTPFVLLAAACFSRGSARWEAWLLNHRYFGPMVRDWREHRAVPLRAKQFATVMMILGSLGAAYAMPRVPWLPALCCLAVGAWLWRLPTKPPRPRQPVSASAAKPTNQ